MDDRRTEYEEAPARREDQPALPIAVVRSCSDDALVAAAEAGERGLIAPLLVGPKERLCRPTARAQLDMWPHEVVAAACVAGNLAGSGKAGTLRKGSLHTDPHARIFGLSLAVVLAACLVLDATSPSTRICQQPDRDFGTTGTNSISTSTRAGPALENGSPVDAFGANRSKAWATDQAGEKPGYGWKPLSRTCRCATGSSISRVGSIIRQRLG